MKISNLFSWVPYEYINDIGDIRTILIIIKRLKLIKHDKDGQILLACECCGCHIFTPP